MAGPRRRPASRERARRSATGRWRPRSEALVELRRGDLEAVIDIERYAQHYPNHYVDWADLRWDDPDHVRGSDDDDFAGHNAELQRYFVPAENLRGISGHILGRLWGVSPPPHLGGRRDRARATGTR